MTLVWKVATAYYFTFQYVTDRRIPCPTVIQNQVDYIPEVLNNAVFEMHNDNVFAPSVHANESYFLSAFQTEFFFT